MVEYKIFTDGSCRANGNGGIGVVWLKNGEKVYEYSKGFKNVTNNIMELSAILCAVKSIHKSINSLEIVTDSEYCIGVLTNPSWKPKKNLELISKIKKQITETQKLVETPIKWTHTKGHSNDKWNNLCDKLATDASSMML